MWPTLPSVGNSKILTFRWLPAREILFSNISHSSPISEIELRFNFTIWQPGFHRDHLIHCKLCIFKCASTKVSHFFSFFNLAIWQPGSPPYPWPHLPQFEHILLLHLKMSIILLGNISIFHFPILVTQKFESPPILKIWVTPNSVDPGKKIAWLWSQLLFHVEKLLDAFSNFVL